MSTWLKKVYNAEGVTEYSVGSNHKYPNDKFGGSGAIVPCIDVRGSMVGKNLNEAKKGRRGLIDDAAGGGNQVGLILWSTQIAAFIAPTADTAVVRRTLDAAQVGGREQARPGARAGPFDADGARGQRPRLCRFHGRFASGLARNRAYRGPTESGRHPEPDDRLGKTAGRGLSSIASEDQPPTTASSTEYLAGDMQQMATGLVACKKRK